MEVSATQVARLYADFLDVFIIDERDAKSADDIRALGMKVAVTNTVMSDLERKVALARETLGAAQT